MLVEPSPKLHDQDVGLPVDVEVNAIVWEITSVPGVKVKAAVCADVVVSLPVSLLVPLLHAEDRRIRAIAAIKKNDINIFFMKIFLSLILIDTL